MIKPILLATALLSLSACATVTPPASAKPAPPAAAPAPSKTQSPLAVRTDQLVDLLKGNIKPEDYFDDRFLAAVPPEQFAAVAQGLIAQYGQPVRVLSSKVGPTGFTSEMLVEFEKAEATVQLAVAQETPYKVTGLLATQFASKNDSFQKIEADFAALPGSAGFLVEKLNDNQPNELVAGRNISKQYAIGSTFKLYILAELAAQVEAGKRKWSDVVPLAHRSFSSEATNRWPDNSPVTLETLALQMISVSDNSATDTLLHTLGRDNVERKLAQIGHSDPDKTLPFLSTVEAFALKAPANAALYGRYIAANEAAQRAMIEKEKTKLGLAQVDSRAFDNGPVHIDTIEWFASPIDLGNLLNHIRRSGNKRMLQILTVNTGISPADAAKWNYVGYKGGSEPGVMSMSVLVQSKSGQYYAVTGSWNNPAKDVNGTQFAAMMSRLLAAVE
jgi:beta-lactamase class A